MTRTRVLVLLAYSLGYMVAVVGGADAAHNGHGWYAAALFTASAAHLVSIRRECHNAAHVLVLVGAYRHHQPPPLTRQAAQVEAATALPPGCHCETWWCSLGDHHHPQCPAAQKEDR